MKTWDSGDDGWQGGDDIVLHNVRAGSTLVLLGYGYFDSQAAKPFSMPHDSTGTIVVAVDAGTARHVPATAWVLHNATAGTHKWTGLPSSQQSQNFADGKLFFMEFHRKGHVSSGIIGGNFSVIREDNGPPYLTRGEVTMSSDPSPGDLLVAFSFEEESGVGNPDGTDYTDPPPGWHSLGSQQVTMKNIGGAACWRIALGEPAVRVEWTWKLYTPPNGPQQDPVIFKGIIFAIR